MTDADEVIFIVKVRRRKMRSSSRVVYSSEC
jgi:hypothetical protein